MYNSLVCEVWTQWKVKWALEGTSNAGDKSTEQQTIGLKSYTHVIVCGSKIVPTMKQLNHQLAYAPPPPPPSVAANYQPLCIIDQ